MEAVIALFILIAAITLNASNPSEEVRSLRQSENTATQTLSRAPENDVSVCDRHDAQMIERGLSVPDHNEISTHE